MKTELTKQEREQIKQLKNEKSQAIRQLLNNDAEKEDVAEYTKENVAENLQFIQKIYERMSRDFDDNFDETPIFYKATSMAEIDQIKKDVQINHFLEVTTDLEKAKAGLANILNRPVLLQIEDIADIPWLQDGTEVILAPFLDVDAIEEIQESTENFKTYKINLSRQLRKILDENSRKKLYQKVIEDTQTACEKIAHLIEVDEENSAHYENIRKLEQLLAKHHFAMEQETYEADSTEEERQSDLDDIARINAELTSLKEEVNKSFNERLKSMQFVVDWKNDLFTYLKSEFTAIDERSCQVPDKVVEVPEIKEEPKAKAPEKKEFVPTGDSEIDSVKTDCLENIAVVQTLLGNIRELIARQQNHARIAKELDSNYKALNNAFEMKNYAEELEALVNGIFDKVDEQNKEALAQISKVNLQVSILLNYLNNAKSAVSKKIKRFDEINILEENELKKEIAETIKNIRCEAELKKLNDDLDIIEDKSNLKKFLGKLTGRSQLDQTMLSQIKVRQDAIRKTFKTKMPLAYNYSIHELIAEIEMFIKENKDDELVTEEVSRLRRIKEILKKNFMIIDSKVVSIVDQKTGKNLPLASRKISKKELIEIDTYRFLNRYGYDKSFDKDEPEYPDTMASEIKRIIDYIKSSAIL